jgi:O-antigen/teichoic acid export membrane protein
MFGHVLFAHQRYDITNYSQVGSLLLNLGVLWLGFHVGWGLYSLLVAYAVSELFRILFMVVAALGLNLLPHGGDAWGRASRKTFHELFSYGQEIFLCTLGWQLISASQVILISRTLGLEAAAVWSIATKAFSLGQTVVFRLLDFSVGALSEMLARQERERLLARFRDITILSASLSIWLALAVALCNDTFLVLWTKGRIGWQPSSNWLMALLIVSYSTTRCFLGLIGLTKQIRRMKYVYFCEGLSFISVSIFAAPRWHFSGIIVTALLTDLLWSGLYGVWRTRQYFDLPSLRTVLGWLRCSALSLLFLGIAFGVTQWLARALGPHLRLGLEAAVALFVGGGLFWLVGLPRNLRSEALAFLAGRRTHQPQPVARPTFDSP